LHTIVTYVSFIEYRTDVPQTVAQTRQSSAEAFFQGLDINVIGSKARPKSKAKAKKQAVYRVEDVLSTCVVKSKSVNPDAPKDGLQEVVHFEIKWDKIKKTTMVPYWDVGQESKCGCIICGVSQCTFIVTGVMRCWKVCQWMDEAVPLWSG
jgi:hypothetical protein